MNGKVKGAVVNTEGASGIGLETARLMRSRRYEPFLFDRDTPLARAVHLEETRQEWIDRVPLERYAQPSELATTIAFLISDDAPYINGHILAVDGGFAHAGLKPTPAI